MKKHRKKRMLFILIPLGLIVLLFVAAYLVGLALPVAHSASVTKTINVPQDQIWRVLVDIEEMPSWRKELISVERTESDSDLPRWVEKSKYGDMPLQVEVLDEPNRLVARIDDESLPYGGTWTWTLEPLDAKTQLTITEDGEVYTPMFRFMSKYVFGHTKTMQTFADQLAGYFEQESN